GGYRLGRPVLPPPPVGRDRRSPSPVTYMAGEQRAKKHWRGRTRGPPGCSPLTAFTRRKKAASAFARRQSTSCKSLLETQRSSGSCCLLASRVAFASAQPGHRSSPSRSRITHQLERARHVPCLNSRPSASASRT